MSLPSNSRQTDPAATIPIVAAWAEGITPIAAFDAALTRAGVGDVNLVSLSSIIPPAHSVRRVEPTSVAQDKGLAFGNLTFCVLAEQRARSGSVAAGLGWVADRSGRGGLFLEGHGPDATVVERELREGLVEMMALRPQFDFGKPDFEIVSGQASGPSCALVVAIFESRPFTSP